LVFIDETGVRLGMTRCRARSNKGKRAYGKRTARRGETLTVIGAICARRIVGAMTLIGSANHEAFGVYLEKVLMPSLWPGAWVVRDQL